MSICGFCEACILPYRVAAFDDLFFGLPVEAFGKISYSDGKIGVLLQDRFEFLRGQNTQCRSADCGCEMRERCPAVGCRLCTQLQAP